MKIGFGYDSHRLVTGRKLILGGVEIPHDKGALGHSDADVGLHAITDALLGCIGEGDIGQHFPPTDERWRGAASWKFLDHAATAGQLASLQRRVSDEPARLGLLDPDVRRMNSGGGPYHPELANLERELAGAGPFEQVSAWELRTYMADVLLRTIPNSADRSDHVLLGSARRASAWRCARSSGRAGAAFWGAVGGDSSPAGSGRPGRWWSAAGPAAQALAAIPSMTRTEIVSRAESAIGLAILVVLFRNLATPVTVWHNMVPMIRTPVVMAVSNQLAVTTWSEFLRVARSRPLNCAGSGASTVFVGKYMMRQLNIDSVQFVPFRGTSDMITQLVAGNLDCAFETRFLTAALDLDCLTFCR